MALGPVYGMGVGSGTGGGYLKIEQEPVQAQMLTYNGQNQSPTWNNFSTVQMSIVEDSGPKKDAGTYEVKIKPVKRYCWKDGTQRIKTFSWTIQPAAIVAPTLSVSSVVFNNDFVSPTVVYDSQIATYGDNPDTVFTVKNLSQKFVNTYTAEWTIKDPNYVWKIATPAVKTASWNITKRPITKPLVSDLLRTYSGVEQGPTITPDTSDLWEKTDYKALDVGTHTLVISLKDPDNNIWAEGDSSNLSFSWTIIALRLQKPTGSNLVFTYDSNTHGPSILNEPGNAYVKRTGPLSEINAGTYQIIYSIAHNNTSSAINVVWDDGTSAGATGNVIIEYVINPIQIPVPTASSTVKTYNAKVQSPGLSDMTIYSKWLDITGTPTATDAGEYTVTYKIKDLYNGQSKNVVWSDSILVSKTIKWRIEVKELSKPTISTTSFVFQSSNINILDYEKFYDETFMDRLGDNTQQSNVGTYSLAYKLKGNTSSQTNVQWSDGSLTEVKLSWKITKKSLTIPKQSGSLTYNTAQQTVTWNSSYEDKFMTVTGITGINAGSYTATFTSRFPGNAQFDSSDTATSTWKIGIKKITKPSLKNNTFTYDNQSQEPVIQNEDLTFSKRSGTTSATNAGNYTIKYTLHKNTSTVINVKWADDSTSDLSLPWVINKAAASKPTLSATSITLTNSTLTKTITVTRDGDGAITATSPDTSKLLVQVDGNKIKLTVNEQADTASPLKFKVGVAEGTNYKAVSANDEVEVSVTISGFVAKLAVASTSIKQKGNLYYRAANLTATFVNFDENYMTVTDNTKKEVGIYTATISCKSGYVFSDGISTVKVSWEIKAFEIVNSATPSITPTITLNNCNGKVISRDDYKFGTSCFYCNGAKTHNVEINLRQNLELSDYSCKNFTLDFWAKLKSPVDRTRDSSLDWPTKPVVLLKRYDKTSTTEAGFGFAVTNTVHLGAKVSADYGMGVDWYHYVIIYDSSNGISIACRQQTPGSNIMVLACARGTQVDLRSQQYLYFNFPGGYAYVDELRLSKTVRWDYDLNATGNQSVLPDYVAPTEPYKKDSNTILLLHFDY